ncbi:MAG: RloB family protein [Crocinitomicaceae bacterium]
MLTRNKLYTKPDPNREGKLYFIFCEGEKRETTYFYFFNHISSQIIIQILPISLGKNSPMGLYNNASQNLLKNDENPNPAYVLNDIDEVWFIIDTDKWGKEIDALRRNVGNHKNWFVAQSNPSFEVWLYYHFQKEKPSKTINDWKKYLEEIILGGFDNRKHPVHIQKAIINSEANFSSLNNQPELITTEIYILAKKILQLVKADIEAILSMEKYQ